MALAAGVRAVGGGGGRGRRVVLLDLVTAAVAVGAGRGADQAGGEERARVLARQVAGHHALVALAALPHLVDGRHRVVGVAALQDRVQAAVAAGAALGADALLGVHAVLELVDLVLVAGGAGGDVDLAEVLARVAGGQGVGVAVGAGDLAVRRARERRGLDLQRVPGVVLEGRVVVAADALLVGNAGGRRGRLRPGPPPPWATSGRAARNSAPNRMTARDAACRWLGKCVLTAVTPLPARCDASEFAAEPSARRCDSRRLGFP